MEQCSVCLSRCVHSPCNCTSLWGEEVSRHHWHGGVTRLWTHVRHSQCSLRQCIHVVHEERKCAFHKCYRPGACFVSSCLLSRRSGNSTCRGGMYVCVVDMLLWDACSPACIIIMRHNDVNDECCCNESQNRCVCVTCASADAFFTATMWAVHVSYSMFASSAPWLALVCVYTSPNNIARCVSRTSGNMLETMRVRMCLVTLSSVPCVMCSNTIKNVQCAHV